MQQSSKQNMKVVVRLRPLSKKETEDISCYETFWEGRKKNTKGKLAQTALNFFTKYHNVKPDEVMKVEGNCVSVCDQEYKNTDRKMRDYYFSEVFSPGISNLDIFETLKDEVQGVFQGTNCTILAYGITGSGKTFSVFGHPKTDRGLSHITFEHIFAKKKELETQNVKIDMKFSFIEIYNQNIRDLLSEDGKRPVVIGEDNKGHISLIDASEIAVKSIDQIVHLISAGTAKRTSAATQFNLISSRSHAVLKVNLEIHQNGQKRTSKLFIIDLAGSEKINNESNRRKQEGSNINRSLLTLGNCINALVDNGKKPGSAHVPYRDSKLTRLLKDSLGGSARTVMVACISPHPFSLDETITTLNYAQRAQGIKRDISSKNIKTVQQECTRCRQLMSILMNSQKNNEDPFENIHLREPLLEIANNEVEGIFLQICERLYSDIVENAKERQQLERLQRELVEPCDEFQLIMKDNEEQRVSLRDILFKLLKEKTKIVIKEQESRTMSARKKIRLSSSSKKLKVRQINLAVQEKQNLKDQLRTDHKIKYNRQQDELFPQLFQNSFNSPKLFSQDDRKSIENQGSAQKKEFQSQKKNRRKRSKFEMVPKPPGYGSASKVSEAQILAEQRMSNA